VARTLPDTVTVALAPLNTARAPGTSGIASVPLDVTPPRQPSPVADQLPEPPGVASLPVNVSATGTPAVGATPNRCCATVTSASVTAPSTSRSYVQTVSAESGRPTLTRSRARSVSLSTPSFWKFTRRNFAFPSSASAADAAEPDATSAVSSSSRSRVSTRPSAVTSAAALKTVFRELCTRSKPKSEFEMSAAVHTPSWSRSPKPAPRPLDGSRPENRCTLRLPVISRVTTA